MLYATQNEDVHKAVHLKQTTVKGTLLFQMSFQAQVSNEFRAASKV